MGFRINTNIAAMNAHRNSQMTNLGLDKSLNSLSSGLRINRAADDASGMAIADSLRQQSQGLGQAISNANDGIGVMQTADGALDEYTNIANIIRTKSIQAASDGQTLKSRTAIQADIDRLMEEAQNIASTTSFNGQTLLNGGFQNKSFHIGAYSGETVNISIGDTQTAKVGEFSLMESTTAATATTAGAAASSASLTVSVTASDGTISTSTGTAQISAGEHSSYEIAQMVTDAFNADAQSDDTNARASVFELSGSTATTPAYGIRIDSSDKITVTETGNSGATAGNTDPTLDNNLATINVMTREGASKAVITSDYALQDLDSRRSDIGSVQNQLEATIKNISVTQVNVQAAESQIRDVDFAAESATFAKLNILAQSGSYAMSQANAVQQNVMKLLQ